MLRAIMQPSALEELLESIQELKQSEVRNLVDDRIREFKETAKKPSEEIFKEICFCILTANYRADRSIRIQNEIGDGFLTLPERQLAQRLKDLGHRFPNARAEYIIKARRYGGSLKTIISSFENETELRDWLIENIRGIGPKEASHFLRNIGYDDLAILDFHVIDVLARCGVMDKPKTLTMKRYVQIEALLREVAGKAGLRLSQLDLYLWYMATGKVLK